MKNIDFQKVLAWLGLVLRCPVCGTKYNLNQTKVVQTADDMADAETRILMHSECHKCKSSVMFNIDINGSDVFSVAVVTDLTAQDSARFNHLKPITADECITLHQGLKKFKGDFVKALKA